MFQRQKLISLVLCSVLLLFSQKAKGAFTNSWTSSETNKETRLDFGDYDGDGDLDIATSGQGASLTGGINTVYRNNGGLSFTSVFTTTETDKTFAFKWGDVDGDGDLDLLAGNYGHPSRVYRNDSGTFNLAWSTSTSYSVSDAEWADLDNDGDLDFILAVQGVNRVFKNNWSSGSGIGFDLAWTSSESRTHQGIRAGDVDGDGDLDMVFATYNGKNSVYKNNGGFSFTYQDADAAGNTAGHNDVQLADMDDDGDLDMVVAVLGAASQLYHNNGTGSFVLDSSWTPPTRTSVTTSLADFDGDGLTDVAFGLGNTSQPTVEVYLNSGGTLSDSAEWSTSLSENAWGIAVGDLDGDYDMDIAVAGLQNSGGSGAAVRVFENDDDPTNSAPSVPTLTAEADAQSGSIKLEWSASTDSESDPESLTYNLRVGTTSNGNEILSAVIPSEFGNVGQSLSWSVNLSPSTSSKTYYWSVQAVDNTGFRKSSFATEDSFVIYLPFTNSWTSSETNQETRIEFGDYDGDGDLDIATADVGASNTGGPNRVYQNNGSGSFTSVWTASDSDKTMSVRWGDYDGDGDLDLLAGNQGHVSRVYQNVGGGSFTNVWSTPSAYAVSDAEWADLDQDGDLDFVLAIGGQNLVFRNNWDGITSSFSLVWTSSESKTHQAVEVGDVDGDGDMDLVFATYNGRNSVYKAGAYFSYTHSDADTDLDAGPHNDLALADMDGDGDLDMVVAVMSASSQLYDNDGSGSFTKDTGWTPASRNSVTVALGDYDGDGKTDAAFGLSTFSEPTIEVFLNTGSTLGNTAYWTISTEENAWGIDTGDADGDGDLELAIAGFANSASAAAPIRLYKNNKPISNTAPSTPSLTAELDGLSGSVTLQWAAASDTQTTDADLLSYNVRVGTSSNANDIFSGKIPAGMGNADHENSLTLKLSASTGTRTYYWSVQAVDNTGFLTSSFASEDSFTVNSSEFTAFSTDTEEDNTYDVEWGDYDNDGDADYLIGNNDGSNGEARVYRNNGDNTFTLVATTSTNEPIFGVAWGDVDGDGDLDIATAGGVLSPSTPTPVRVYLNLGSNTFTLNWSSSETMTVGSVDFGDYDNDGDLDILNGQIIGRTRIYQNDGTGTFSNVWQTGANRNTFGVAWGDVDNDGDLDFAMANTSNVNDLYRNDSSGGTTTFSALPSSSESENTRSLAWGDVDGDGDLDLAVANAGTVSVPGKVNRVYLNNGTQLETTASWVSDEADETYAVSWGDIDGDGYLDLVAFSEERGGSTGSKIYKNNSGTLDTEANWSFVDTTTKSGAIADSDLDGDIDFLVATSISNSVTFSNVLRVNYLNPTNTAPSTPTLNSRPNSLSGSVTLSWSASTDSQTSDADLLTYNLRIGTTPGGHEILSGIIPTGPGNVGQALSHAVTLSAGGSAVTYYWSVQSIDTTSFKASSWATEGSFEVKTSLPKLFNPPKMVQMTIGFTSAPRLENFTLGDMAFDLVDFQEPSKSCLKPDALRQAKLAGNSNSVPLDIDWENCGNNRPMNLVIKGVPPGWLRNLQNEFPCKKSITASEIASSPSISCNLTSPENGGDANGDRKVNILDFGLLKQEFGKDAKVADFNKDGKVDLADFGILKQYFGLNDLVEP